MNSREKINMILPLAICGFIIASLFWIVWATRPDYENPETWNIQHNGHDYIGFHVTGTHGSSYVHNPECHCHNGPAPE